MNKDCNVIRDLIPVYAENLASEESRKMIDEHCESCEECKQMLSKLILPIKSEAEEHDERMKEVWGNIEDQEKRKRNIKRSIIAIGISVLVVITYIYGVCFAQYKLTGYFGISGFGDFNPIYFVLAGKSYKTTVEFDCQDIVENIVTKAQTTLGDYSKLSEKDKQLISEENFEYMCFRECATDNEHNSLHRLEKYVNDEIMYCYPAEAKQMNGYILVTYGYYYEYFKSDFFLDSKKWAKNNLFTGEPWTVYVKMTYDGDRYYIEDVFEPVVPDREFFPDWAK